MGDSGDSRLSEYALRLGLQTTVVGLHIILLPSGKIAYFLNRLLLELFIISDTIRCSYQHDQRED